MKPAITILLLLSTLAANAASVAFEWTPSTTPGCSNVFYLSQSALTNLATATWKFPLGTNTTARATLSPGTWHLAVTAVNSDVESDPARRAALQLAGGEETETDIREQLLADIRTQFKEAKVDRLFSKDLCEGLAQIEGRPWAEFGFKNPKPISKNQLAYQLRDLGIVSRSIRIGDATGKGYHLDDFTDAFARYLPDNGIPKRHTVTTPVSIEENSLFANVTSKPCDVSENAPITNNGAGCDVVTDRKAVETPEPESEAIRV